MCGADEQRQTMSPSLKHKNNFSRVFTPSPWTSPKQNIMAIDGGGGRSCGVHELICARRVSPELLGVLSSIAAFMGLMALFFLYLSNKLSVESTSDLSCLDDYRPDQQEL
ncbi:uncharacterized protein ACWYII_021415 [Salvelinus alpinus]